MVEIRFVGTGETRGYPYLVCKNIEAHEEKTEKMRSKLTEYEH